MIDYNLLQKNFDGEREKEVRGPGEDAQEGDHGEVRGLMCGVE